MKKIKFIVDESVDYSVVGYIRGNGFDVISVAEDFSSSSDIEVLNYAFNSNRILVTNDKDFGTLIFKENLKTKGVILLRLEDQSSQAAVNVIKLIFSYYYDKFPSSFVVVSESKIRIRKIL